jgi:hydrogenase/urease accessory protein HupE
MMLVELTLFDEGERSPDPEALWDPILAMVAVGIWASQIGRPAWWVLPLIFPAAMIGGGVLGWLGVPVPAG